MTDFETLKSQLQGADLALQAINTQVKPLRRIPGPVGNTFKRLNQVVEVVGKQISTARSVADLLTAKDSLRTATKILVSAWVSEEFAKFGATTKMGTHTLFIVPRIRTYTPSSRPPRP
jgi:hypothetical protein